MAPPKEARPHSGQYRDRFFRKRVPLKHDVFDRIVCTSHLVNKDLLQRQGMASTSSGLCFISRSVASCAFIRMMRVCTRPSFEA